MYLIYFFLYALIFRLAVLPLDRPALSSLFRLLRAGGCGVLFHLGQVLPRDAALVGVLHSIFCWRAFHVYSRISLPACRGMSGCCCMGSLLALANAMVTLRQRVLWLQTGAKRIGLEFRGRLRRLPVSSTALFPTGLDLVLTEVRSLRQLSLICSHVSIEQGRGCAYLHVPNLDAQEPRGRESNDSRPAASTTPIRFRAPSQRGAGRDWGTQNKTSAAATSATTLPSDGS